MALTPLQEIDKFINDLTEIGAESGSSNSVL